MTPHKPRGWTALATRREEILALATQLFSKQGVQGTSMRDLANAAGVMPSSLYSHFASKEALADEILREYLEDFLRQCQALEISQPVAIDRLRGLIRVSLEGADAFPAALVIFHRDLDYLTSLPRFAYLFDLYLTVRTIWLKAITDAMSEGDLQSDVDPVVYFRWLRDALTMTSRWHERGQSPHVHELTEFAERVFLRGMLANTERKSVRRRNRTRPAIPPASPQPPRTVEQ
jgi:TetR/AcrR family transcriptional regulator, cholesterol catabolism regulator